MQLRRNFDGMTYQIRFYSFAPGDTAAAAAARIHLTERECVKSLYQCYGKRVKEAKLLVIPPSPPPHDASLFGQLTLLRVVTGTAGRNRQPALSLPRGTEGHAS